MTATVDMPPGNLGLTAAQSAALEADTTDGSYRVALLAVHPGELDLHALAQALMELRRRHDVLRTTVRYNDDGPVGTVSTQTVVPVELVAGPPPHSADGLPPKRLDLTTGPLVHVAVFSDVGGRTLLGFQAHPVVLDEETVRRAVHELGLLYRYFAGGGPFPPVTRVGYREHAARMRSTAGRVPRRMPVVSHEVGPATADRVRLIGSSRGLPVALLVLAAWITAGAATSGAATAPVATSLPDPSGKRPLGPVCDRILLRGEPGAAYDVVALAEHLRAATADTKPDDGDTPLTFTFHDDRPRAGGGPFEVVEASGMLAPSEDSLAVHSTSAAGWLLRLTHRADIASSTAARATLARTVALLDNAGASLVDEELL
ncbi:condensation domain-containing protein [Streptomyces hyaluromycini]|uniref:condensation domain-containing protein n=1 Tax=Streptomyces hyaluromycini TaxID=1377993 RepID=UPI000B5C3A27|nr:condensation domain-containing protein [Streptomyces hyaluromycini]